MNAAQFEIVKRFASFPKMNLQKMAKTFGIAYLEIVKVQRSNNFENYQTEDYQTEDLIDMMKKMGLS